MRMRFFAGLLAALFAVQALPTLAAGTTASAGSPAHEAATSSRKAAVFARLREQAATGSPLLPAANPPHITPGGQESALPGSVLVPWDSGRFFYAGNMVRSDRRNDELTFARNDAVTFKAGAGRYGSFLAFEFVTDAPQLEVLVKGNGRNSRMRFVVDGALANTVPVEYPADDQPHLTKLDFGSRKTRHIRVLASAPLFGGVRIGPGDTLSRPAADPGLRVMFIGDSYTQGPAREPAETSYAPIAAQLLGWRDAWVSGVGGTGYVNAPDKTLTFRQRFATDIKPFAPDVLVIAGGGNDRPYTDGQVYAAAKEFFDLVEHELPDTVVFVLGPWNPRSLVRPGLNDAIRRAAANRANFVWVRNYEDNWITGTGSVNAPAKNGNSDWVIGHDRLHPTPAGIDYLAGRFADAIKALVRQP